MVNINISIKEEAYRFLRSLKHGEKSFSDVILGFKKDSEYDKSSKEAVLQFAGVLKNKGIDWKAREKKMEEFRKEFNKRVEKTIDYMEKSRK